MPSATTVADLDDPSTSEGGPLTNKQPMCNLSLTFFIVNVQTCSMSRKDQISPCQFAKPIASPSRQLWADLKYFAVAAYRFLRGSGRVSHITFRSAKTSTDENQNHIVIFLALQCQNNHNGGFIAKHVLKYGYRWRYSDALLWVSQVCEWTWLRSYTSRSTLACS